LAVGEEDFTAVVVAVSEVVLAEMHGADSGAEVLEDREAVGLAADLTAAGKVVVDSVVADWVVAAVRVRVDSVVVVGSTAADKAAADLTAADRVAVDLVVVGSEVGPFRRRIVVSSTAFWVCHRTKECTILVRRAPVICQVAATPQPGMRLAIATSLNTPARKVQPLVPLPVIATTLNIREHKAQQPGMRLAGTTLRNTRAHKVQRPVLLRLIVTSPSIPAQQVRQPAMRPVRIASPPASIR
jgi:hypothetical protein